MKKVTFLLLVVFITGMFSSCKKEEEKDPVLNMDAVKVSAITEPIDQDFVLLEDEADELINFVWTATEYDFQELETVKYLLQMDITGESFEDPAELTSTTELEYSISVSTINTRLKSLGLDVDIAHDVFFRMVAYVYNKTEYTNAYSDVVKNTFTPYDISTPPTGPDKLWAPGDYQGWDPATSSNLYSLNNDGKYEGYIYFPPGGTNEFKFTAAPDWDHTGFGPGAEEGTLDPEAGFVNLAVPDAGNYFLTADTIGLVWTHELRTFTLVGTFNEWGGTPDSELTWDDTNKMWTVNIDLPAAAEFKWRANADWAVNLGIKDPDDGTLENNGLNIIIAEEGNYTINLYLGESLPRYELIKN